MLAASVEMYLAIILRLFSAAVFIAFLSITLCPDDARYLTGLRGWLLWNTIFDYVVVGGGTAGITIGTRLAQHGFKVAVVEAGGYYENVHPISQVPGAAILGVGASVSTATAVDWKFVAHAVPGAGYRDIHYPRGKCLGGSYVRSIPAGSDNN